MIYSLSIGKAEINKTLPAVYIYLFHLEQLYILRELTQHLVGLYILSYPLYHWMCKHLSPLLTCNVSQWLETGPCDRNRQSYWFTTKQQRKILLENVMTETEDYNGSFLFKDIYYYTILREV